jgi:hypothetical protein
MKLASESMAPFILSLGASQRQVGVGKPSQKFNFPVWPEMLVQYPHWPPVHLWCSIWNIFSFLKSLKMINYNRFGCVTMFLRFWYRVGWSWLLLSDYRVEWKFCNHSLSNFESKYDIVVCMHGYVPPLFALWLKWCWYHSAPVKLA